MEQLSSAETGLDVRAVARHFKAKLVYPANRNVQKVAAEKDGIRKFQ